MGFTSAFKGLSLWSVASRADVGVNVNKVRIVQSLSTGAMIL